MIFRFRNRNIFVYVFPPKGKSACDGIGASVKRLVRRRAIQGNDIKTPKEFFDACRKLDSSIAFDFCTNEEVHRAEIILNDRYENYKVRQIVGTRKFHGFIPINSQEISAKTFSFSALTKQFVIAIPIPRPLP